MDSILMELKTNFGDILIGRLGEDLSSHFPHPEGKLWGRSKGHLGDTIWHLGRTQVFWTPRRLTKKDRAGFVFAVNFGCYVRFRDH